MSTFRQIREQIEDWVEVDNAPQVIRRTANQVLRQITQKRRFDALQDSRTVTPVEGVITVPPLCRQITRITATGTSASRDRFRPARAGLHYDGPTMIFDRFYPVGVSNDWDLRATAFTFAAANPDTLLTTATLTAAMVGKLLRIDGSDDFYEVTAVETGVSITITPEYTGSRTAGTYSLGNFGLPQYQLDDSVGTAYASDVVVDYQRYHPPLLSDNDILLIPVNNTLVLQSVNRLLHYAKYAVDAQRLKEDIMEAENAEMPQEVMNRHIAPHKPDAFASQGVATRWNRR